MQNGGYLHHNRNSSCLRDNIPQTTDFETNETIKNITQWMLLKI